VLLTILRSSVLPHKHPHELLDSVVKERFDQAFRLNRGRAFYSSLSTCQALFRKFLFYSIACRLAEPTTSRSGRRIIQRQFPLSTAFLSPPRSIRPRHQQRHNLRPASAAHSTRIRHLCNPFQLSNLLIQKAFLLQFAAKVVRIIGGFGWASIAKLEKHYFGLPARALSESSRTITGNLTARRTTPGTA